MVEKFEMPWEEHRRDVAVFAEPRYRTLRHTHIEQYLQ